MGTFPRGVPQGVPSSGTVLVNPGAFSIKRPERGIFSPFCAVLLPFTQDPRKIALTIPVGLVGIVQIRERLNDEVRLTMRPQKITDPPILVALSSPCFRRVKFAIEEKREGSKKSMQCKTI